MQHSVDKAIISYHSDNAGIILAGLNIFARRFPYPAYHHDNFMWVFIGLFPWIVVFVFSHNVLSIVGTIVSEKESRLKVTSFYLLHFGPMGQMYVEGLIMPIYLALVNFVAITMCKFRSMRPTLYHLSIF